MRFMKFKDQIESKGFDINAPIISKENVFDIYSVS